jgi:hypothetical protein
MKVSAADISEFPVIDQGSCGRDLFMRSVPSICYKQTV